MTPNYGNLLLLAWAAGLRTRVDSWGPPPHKKPDVREIIACNVWLDKEITDLKAPVIVALGASALRAWLGSTPLVDAARRQTSKHASGATIVATYHPSAILRAEGERGADLRARLRIWHEHATWRAAKLAP
jgi:uracil-DNA glycosylase family 4